MEYIIILLLSILIILVIYLITKINKNKENNTNVVERLGKLETTLTKDIGDFKYDFSKITDFTYFFDSSKLIEVSIESEIEGDCEHMFKNCQYLQKVNLPKFFSRSAYGLFYWCFKLTEPNINTSNCI